MNQITAAPKNERTRFLVTGRLESIALLIQVLYGYAGAEITPAFTASPPVYQPGAWGAAERFSKPFFAGTAPGERMRVEYHQQYRGHRIRGLATHPATTGIILPPR